MYRWHPVRLAIPANQKMVPRACHALLVREVCCFSGFLVENSPSPRLAQPDGHSKAGSSAVAANPGARPDQTLPKLYRFVTIFQSSPR
jgi:hypothetical protein